MLVHTVRILPFALALLLAVVGLLAGFGTCADAPCPTELRVRTVSTALSAPHHALPSEPAAAAVAPLGAAATPHVAPVSTDAHVLVAVPLRI